MTTIGVIANPAAGSGRGARTATETMSLLAARGHRVRDLSRGGWVASLEHARESSGELDALVVVGGDGMTHLGIQVCATTPLPLGIVAAGSGNDAAASLGLPEHDVRAAVAAIERGLAGDVATVDLGSIEGGAVADPLGRRYFLAVLSAGLDAAVAAYANRLTIPRGRLKYVAATLREVPRFRPYGVRLEVDGEAWEQQCTLVAVANGPVFGGGLAISPESSLVDGVLELVLAEPMSPVAIARVFPRLRHGSHLGDPRVRIVQATHIRLSPTAPLDMPEAERAPGTAPGAPLPPAFADGELIGPAPLDVSVVPGALRVLGAKADSLKA